MKITGKEQKKYKHSDTWKIYDYSECDFKDLFSFYGKSIYK